MSGTFNRGLGLKVWDLEGSSPVRELESASNAEGLFSPAGRWLATSAGDRYQVWETGGWTVSRSFPREVDVGLPGPLAWSPDGTQLAIASNQSEVQVLNVETGDLVARLRAPRPRRALALRFSPDGEMLLVARANATTEVWDLRRIGEGLSALGLQFGVPLAPKRPRGSPRSLRLESHAGTGELEVPTDPARLLELATSLQRRGKWKEAAKIGEKALEASPGSAEAMNNLAWALLAGPEEARDPRRAAALAEAAVRAGAENPAYLNTLGVAQYRLGNFREAIDTLLRGARAGGAVTAWDGFFIAMALKRLGFDSLAADYNENAVRWLERHAELSREEARDLGLFRAEAASVLGAGGSDSGSTGPGGARTSAGSPTPSR